MSKFKVGDLVEIRQVYQDESLHGDNEVKKYKHKLAIIVEAEHRSSINGPMSQIFIQELTEYHLWNSHWLKKV